MLKKGATAYRGVTMRYGVRQDALPATLLNRFVPMHADEETRRWIDDAFVRPHGAMAMAARKALAKVMSDYDANGLLGTHDMRVLGPAQWRLLLSDGLDTSRPTRVLDVGAGDGRVTDALCEGLGLERDHVVTTELSPRMAARLRERGYACIEADLASAPISEDHGGPFDLILMLNVLDRSSRPLSLVERLRDLLTTDGRLVVSAPLPLKPHVHVGPVTLDPEERLPIDERGWEEAAGTLTEMAFAPLGLYVDRLTRAPYLCRGSKQRPVVVLDDAIFVLRRRP